MSKKLFSTIGILLFFFAANAQSPSWQWGKRGGSSISDGTGGADEMVADMATDSHGNIYVLSSVQTGTGTGVNVDGHAITGWGVQDILLTSFKCDGTYRWSKDLGGTNQDYPVALKTDTLGGVYVMGELTTYFITVHLDVDSSWNTGTICKEIFLAKYDSAGNYKWFRMPDPDTMSLAMSSAHCALDMDIDGGGNICLMCALPPGAYGGGGYVATSTGVHILKYDRNGNFIGGNPLQITYTSTGVGGLSVRKDYALGKYYVTSGKIGIPTAGAGVPGLTMGSTTITRPLYIGAFNNAGTMLWLKQDVNIYSGGTFSRAVIDAQHNIYAEGQANNNDTFNTYVVVNPLALSGGDVPIVVKLDTNGNNVWAISGQSNAAVDACANVSLNGNEVVVAGAYSAKLKWSTDSLLHAGSCDYSPFITRLNKNTGAVIDIDSIASACGFHTVPTMLSSDKYGNVYVGGEFPSTITVNGTTITSAGGGSDFFVAKYGTSNCSVPITLETSPDLSKGEEILRVYPNPATEELNITGITQNTTYRLLSITGTTVLQGLLKQGENTIQMRNCASGLYILQMNGEDGQRNMVKVVKQ